MNKELWAEWHDFMLNRSFDPLKYSYQRFKEYFNFFTDYKICDCCGLKIGKSCECEIVEHPELGIVMVVCEIDGGR